MRGANPDRTKRARILRRNDNEAEALLWAELRGRRLNGFKFVRQYPIGPYFADFACREALLVVEIDGSQHVDNSYDETRNSFMTLNGWSVARFWNTDVFTECESVLETIAAALERRLAVACRSRDFRFFPAVRPS